MGDGGGQMVCEEGGGVVVHGVYERDRAVGRESKSGREFEGYGSRCLISTVGTERGGLS